MNPLSITVKSSCVPHSVTHTSQHSGSEQQRLSQNTLVFAGRTPSSELLVTLPSSRGDRARMATTVQNTALEPMKMGLSPHTQAPRAAVSPLVAPQAGLD